MVITRDDKILRLSQKIGFSKKWRVKKIIREFPNKNWKSSPLKDLLRKIDKTGHVQRYPGSGRPGDKMTVISKISIRLKTPKVLQSVLKFRI